VGSILAKIMLIFISAVLMPFSLLAKELETSEYIEKIKEARDSCEYNDLYFERKATDCYFDRLAQIASQSKLDIQFVESYRQIRHDLISQIEGGVISLEQAQSIEASKVEELVGIDKRSMARIKSKWHLRAFAGVKEIEPNINPDLLFHDSENKCKAAIQVIERTFSNALKEMPVAFFCKENPYLSN
jgi:ERCC4-type nuclease